MTRALVRHFWSALFDFGVLTQAGADAFTRVSGATAISTPSRSCSCASMCGVRGPFGTADR